jgi:rRNA processing protein Krr1/Pno1
MDADGLSLSSLQGRLDGCNQELADIKISLSNKRGKAVVAPAPSKTPPSPTRDVPDADINNRKKGRGQAYPDVSKLQRNLLSSSVKIHDEVEALRGQENHLCRRQHELEAMSEELRASIRRVKAANALKSTPSDVVEVVLSLTAEKVNHIKAKGPSFVKSVEAKCHVVIEVDRDSNNMRILGRQQSILLASTEFNAVSEKYSEEVYLSDQKIVCLLLRKAQLLQQTQNRQNVRIDVSRARGSCKIYGCFDDVKAAVEIVRQIDGKRADVPFKEEMCPYVFGQGDEILRNMEGSHGVQIEVNKETLHVVVLGPAAEVASTAKAVETLLQENVPTEGALLVSRKFVLQCVLGNAGATARKLQRDLEVTFSTIGLEDDEKENVQLIMCGSRAKVQSAMSELQHMHTNFLEQNFEILIPDSCVAVFVGKKGCRIQALRTKYSDASIELDGGRLRVKCDNMESRKAIKEHTETLIRENFSRLFEVDGRMLSLLRSPRGKCVRDALRDLKVSCDFEAADNGLALRGLQKSVDEAWEELNKFVESSYNETLELDNEDRIFLQVPFDSEDSIQDILETEFNVVFSVNRKENTVTIFGLQANVIEAFAAVKECLNGSEVRGTTIIEMPPFVVPFLIGKEGSNSKKFERENNVKLNFNTVSNTVRIRLNPSVVSSVGRDVVAQMLRQAVTAVKCEARQAPISRVLTVDSKWIGKAGIDPQLWTQLLSVSDRHGVVIANAFRSKVCISGPSGAVEEASVELLRIITGQGKYIQHLSEDQLEWLQQRGVLDVVNQTSVNISFQLNGMEVVGPVAELRQVKLKLWTLLTEEFRGCFADFAVDPVLLEDFGGYKLRSSIEDETGAEVHLDIEDSCLRVSGTPKSVSWATTKLESELASWIERTEYITVDAQVSKDLVALHTAVIRDFENEMQVKVKVKTSQIQIEGSDRLISFIARSRIEEWLDSLSSNFVELAIPNVSIGAFIGKGGAHIRQLRVDSGATIDFASETGQVKISGDPQCIQDAEKRIAKFLANEASKRYSVALAVPAAYFIGRVPREVSDYIARIGIKFELDRARSEICLRGRFDYNRLY